MTKDEALKLALETLECWQRNEDCNEPMSKILESIKEALAQQEPVAWATREDFYRELDRKVERMRNEMEIKTVTMRCKDYDVALNIVDMYGGHVVVGQVSFTPQREWIGLTEEQFLKAARLAEDGNYLVAFQRIHQWLREKNT